MLKPEERIIGVNVLSEADKNLVKAYLQGCVYCWCNTKGTEWFSARDFLGGDNYFWEGTPAMFLYEAFLNNKKDNTEYAFEEAAKAAGKLLKQVLYEDKRTFESKDGYTRSYRWDGKGI